MKKRSVTGCATRSTEAADENGRRPRPADGDGDHKFVLEPELEQILQEVSGAPAPRRE